MSTATLRRVGGSVIMAIPKHMLELVHLHSGSQVNIDVQGGKLIIEPKEKPHYTLAELMAQCELPHSIDAEEKNWLNDPAVGDEEL